MGVKNSLGIKRRTWIENILLGRMLGLKKDDVIGGWRNLLNDECCNLYSSTNIMRVRR
jgi:hypothetical protein